jgi:manganese transport protein
MKRWLAVIFWSVITAAFIGPGTVTSCAAAGAKFGPTLLWALTFSTVATIVLQEAAARLGILSGRDLGSALRDLGGEGARAVAVKALVVGAIVLGCAAYQAGNLLGAAAGAELATGLSPVLLALVFGVVAAVLLALGAPGTVANVLSITVAVMGIAFLVTALGSALDVPAVLRGAFVPAAPEGSGLLVLGLVGTTVVPYNLFLGSSLAVGKQLGEARFGISLAIGFGGLISMGILLAGIGVPEPFSFAAVADHLAARLGPWASSLFGWGLCAAGLSSAVTAPLAAALTARGLFARGADDPRWTPRGSHYRAVWIGVLLVGLGFALSSVPRIPAILVAQAFNGVLLPVAAIFLWLAVNDRRLLGESGLNGRFANVVTGLVVAVAVILGTAGLVRAAAGALGRPAPGEGMVLGAGVAAVLLLAGPVVRALRARRV